MSPYKVDIQVLFPTLPKYNIKLNSPFKNPTLNRSQKFLGRKSGMKTFESNILRSQNFLDIYMLTLKLKSNFNLVFYRNCAASVIMK